MADATPGTSTLPLRTNRLVASMPSSDVEMLRPHFTFRAFRRGSVLVEAGEDVTKCFFPCDGMITSLIVALPDGALAETATIGREGAVGGIVSLGHKPAFARSTVQVGGGALVIETVRLEQAKERSSTLRDLLARYADCLIAQILQSVACNVLHSVEPRLCRWLLHFHDRAGGSELTLTQEMLGEMLGVQRTTVTSVAAALESRGLIETGRGRIFVKDRTGLEASACACHGSVVDHYERVLPGVYPLNK